jgi:hypothetical protein
MCLSHPVVANRRSQSSTATAVTAITPVVTFSMLLFHPRESVGARRRRQPPARWKDTTLSEFSKSFGADGDGRGPAEEGEPSVYEAGIRVAMNGFARSPVRRRTPQVV